MTREEAIKRIQEHMTIHRLKEQRAFYITEALDMAIKSLKQESNIKALGEDMRICQKVITDEKVLIGFNMAVSICNKHLAESEGGTGTTLSEKNCKTCGQNCAIKHYGCSNWTPICEPYKAESEDKRNV